MRLALVLVASLLVSVASLLTVIMLTTPPPRVHFAADVNQGFVGKRQAAGVISMGATVDIPTGPLELRWFGRTEQPDTGLKRGLNQRVICVTDGTIGC